MMQFLELCLLFSALLVIPVSIRAVRGPRFTDRLVAINLLSTLTLAVICILTLVLGEDFLMDVALVYALVSFVTVAVLAKILIRRRREQIRKERVAAHRTQGGKEK